MKVLIIDDSHDALAIAKVRLAKEDVIVICADCGQAGLEMAKSQMPDLILLDIEMPDISGFDVCRDLKADIDLAAIPVIFLSASDSPQDKVRGLDLGAVDYVTKPFDAFELRARVRAALRTKRLHDLLIKYSQIDPLTELFNRRSLMDRLTAEWSKVQRHGEAMSFIMADIDHFKDVNDAYGHQVGDRVLQEVSQLMQDLSRLSDCVTRYGGEEFAIICCNEPADGAMQFAERLRQNIEEFRVTTSAGEVRVTMSFGVSSAANAASVEQLIAAADEAVYQAKRDGRNRVVMAAVATQAAK